MLPLLTFLAFVQFSSALPSLQYKPLDSLRILDTGVGHRSTPVPRWRTSLRGLTTRGTNASILQQFGSGNAPGLPAEPINAYSLAYSPSTASLYSVTGQGIIRTGVDGSNPEVVVVDQDGGSGQIVSVTVAEKEGKLYYGTLYEGLIKRADLDGKNVEVVRNVSQGINYDIIPSYRPANFHANGLLVDDENGWLYWSASNGPDDGSVRRTLLNSEGEEQVLASSINVPGQIRLVKDTNTLYWSERGRWNTSPTAIKRFDLSQLRNSSPTTPSPTSPLTAFATYTVVHSDESNLFFENDYTGDKQTLSIQSFVVFRNGIEQKIWFVAQSSGRTIFGKLVEVTWKGSGDGRKAMFEVLAANTTDIGVPVGLEYV